MESRPLSCSRSAMSKVMNELCKHSLWRKQDIFWTFMETIVLVECYTSMSGFQSFPQRTSRFPNQPA
jgi:hypothetical protein